MTKLGFQNITLGKSIEKNMGFRRVSGTIYTKQYSFRPVSNYYYAEDLTIYDGRLPFRIANLFIGCDNNGVVKRITVFVKGQRQLILPYLSTISNVIPSEGISHQDGTSSKRYYVWITDQSSSIVFSDLSHIYLDDQYIIDFFITTDIEAIQDFNVIRWPNLVKELIEPKNGSNSTN